MALLTEFAAPIDADRLIAAFGSVVAASDTLRTTIADDGTVSLRPIGAIAPTPIVDLAGPDEARPWAAARAATPIDLRRAVYDSTVLRYPDGTVAWYLAIHHVATDATSSSLVAQATAAAYGDAGVPELASYYDWWSEPRSDARAERAARHWYTRQAPPRVGRLYRQSAGDQPATHREALEIGELWSEIESALDGPYKMLSPDLAWTTFLLSVAGAYLARVSGATSFALGMPVHNRSDADARDLIGPLMEVFPVDMEVDLAASFADLQRATARAVLTTLRHARPGAVTSEVEAVVNVIPRARLESFGSTPSTTSWVHSGAADPSHLFRLQLTPYGDTGELLLDLNLGAVDADHLDRGADHLTALLAAAVRTPDVPIGDVAMLNDADQAELDAWSRGAERTPAQPIARRVADALAANVATAIVDGDETLTGVELERRIGRVARWLRDQGVGGKATPERVAIDMPRSIDAVVAIHAVTRAGGSFVPLDPSQPQQRRDRLVERGGCVLTLDTLPVDDDLPAEVLEASDPDPDREAYLLFTSGSTGEPKGVPITHRGLADYVEFAQDAYVEDGLVPVAPLFSALTFDLTITTVFVPFARGGRLVVIRESGGAGLSAIAARDDLTWMKATPSHLEILLRLGMASSLRSLVVGGEAFLGRVARRLFRALPDVRIFNEYGPTEAVVGCMIHEATPESLGDAADVPIGIPSPGVTLRIVDDRLTDVARGASGELLIGHDGLTAGYLDAEHDEGKFVELDGQRFYRSGDLVRLADAGTAVYQGRIDEQIKLGGIRLEPVEIEHALIAHPAIARATVRVWEPERKPAAQHCVRCGLPSNVPGSDFDADGVCNSCHDYDRVKVQAEDYFRTPDDLKAVQRAARAVRSGKYDALHLLSGGKDSTYALYQLHEMGFEVYSMTLDNGYISEGAKENVRQSVAELGIDHEFVTIDAMDDIFRDSLERFSNVCHGCYKTIYTVATSRADELGIPVIVTGLSRGQLFETRLIPQQFSSERFDVEAIDRAVIEARRAYHRIDDAPRRLLDTEVFDRPDDDVFSRISYVDFYRYVDVPLSEMYDYLDNNAPWVRPDDTGRSTNCLVNAAGIHSHLTEQGYHNYAMPYAWDVRLGHKTRTEAMEELDDELDMVEIGDMLGKIGFDPKPQQTLTAWIEPVVGGDVPTPAQLRTFLADRIPSYAVPAAFVQVDEIPMTSNGKVDTRQLPAPTRTHRTGAAVRIEPESQLEREIVGAYEQVLSIDGVGVTDDFFDLGGDSLAAIGLAVQLSERLGRTVREEEVFANTNPRDLSAVLAVDEGAAAGPVPRDGDTPPTINEAERGLLFEYLNDPDDPRYNVGVVFTLGAGVDADRLIDAIRAVVAAHVPLSWTYSEPRTRLPIDDALEVIVRGEPVDEPVFVAASRRLHVRPFDLLGGPLGRCVVQPLDDGGLGLFLSFHHISIDAYSFEKLWNQIDAVYGGTGLPDLPVDYADWSRWQLANLADDATEPWLDGFAPGAPIRLGEGGGDSGYVSMPASFDLQGLRTGPGATPVATALGALTSVLGARALGERLTIDLLLSSREHPSADDLIGYFLNPLPIELRAAEGATGVELAEQAGDAVRGALAHRTVPRGRIVADRRTRNLPELSDEILFIFEDWNPGSLGSIPARHEVLATGSPVTGASFFVIVDDGVITLGLEHDGRLLTADEAGTLLAELDAAILAMIDEPSRPLFLGRASDMAGAIVDGPALDVPPLAIHEFVRDHSRRNPGAVAIRQGDAELTYGDLDTRAQHLASALIDAGATEGEQVAIVLPRSIEQIVAIQAVLMTGAAYVPVDPSYPTERQALILDAASPIAVVASELSALHAERGLQVIDPAIVPEGALHSVPRVDPDAIAYVIHTSGSSGRPKGVPVRHRNIVATTRGRQQSLPTSFDSFLLLSSFAFDSSMVGIFGTLTAGGVLVLPTDDERDDLLALADLVQRHGVGHTLCLPSLYRALLAEAPPGSLDSLDTVIVAGEACPADLVTAHRQATSARLVNEYGPTETAVWSHAADLTDDPLDDGVPIGWPGPGVRAVVVDGDLLPVAAGEVGELLIGGAGVTGGYLDAADLTRQKFVSLPYDTKDDVWYRSGDLVRSRVDGALVFAGRADDQIKVRGFRVEPEEVELAIRRVAGVADAAVDGRTVRGRTQLVAWIVGAVDPTLIRAALQQSVPEHLVPTQFVPVEELPVGVTGKVDRKALRLGDEDSPGSQRNDAPDVAVEVGADDAVTRMAAIWADVLQIDIGPDDDYLESGGDSILSLQITTRARAAGWQIRPRDVLEHGTVRALVGAIEAPSGDSTASSSAPPVAVAPDAAGPDLTPADHWFFDNAFAVPDHWNQTITVGIEPDTDVERLVGALDLVRAAHASLRSRFVDGDQGPRRVVDPAPAPLIVGDRLDEVVAQIDVSLGRTMGVVIGPDASQLIVTAHHLVVDAVSWNTILEDWSRCHADPATVLDPTDPRPWIRHVSARSRQTRLDQRGVVADPLSWEAPEPGRDPVLLDVPAEITARLLSQARTSGGGVRDQVVGVVAHAVAAARGVARVGVTLEGHGRESLDDATPDVSRTVGWFTALHGVSIEVGPDVASTIEAASRSIADVPLGGAAESIDRHLGGREVAPLPYITVNYLGDLDRSMNLTAPFVGTPELTGNIDPANAASHAVGVLAYVRDGRLQLTVDAPSASITDPDAFGQALVDALVSVVDTDTTRSWPLTPAQQGMLFHCLNEPSPTLYLEQVRLPLSGPVDPDRVRSAWSAVTAAHDTLRSRVVLERGEPRQEVVDDELRWALIDLAADDLDRFAAADRDEGIALDGPLQRVTLCRLGDDTWELVWTFHHLALDGWSAVNVIDQFVAAYDDPDTIDGDLPQFARFVEWQAARRAEDGLDHWRDLLRGFDEPLVLGADRGPQPGAVEGGRLHRSLTVEQAAEVRAAATRLRVTPSALFQTAWSIVLSRHSDRDDVVFGVTSAGRPPELDGADQTVGMFLATLPMRVQVPAPGTGVDTDVFVRDVFGQGLDLIDQSASALAEIVATTDLPPGASLFDTILIFENYPVPAPRTSSIEVGERSVFEQTHYPLTLMVRADDQLRVEALYDARRLDADSVDVLVADLLSVVVELADHAAPIDQLPFLGDRGDLLEGPSVDRTGLPRDVVAWFDQQAVAAPSAPALRDEQQTIDRATLAARSVAVADGLAARGVGPGHAVGISLGRSVETVVAMLAVMRTGAAYVMIDAGTPRPRLEAMVASAGVRLVLTDDPALASLDNVDTASLADAASGDAIDAGERVPHGTAFVTFTSGSTGVPKAVPVGQAALVHRLAWQLDLSPIVPAERVIAKTSWVFVDHLFEVWGPLVGGGECVVVGDDAARSLTGLLELIRVHEPRRLLLVPSLLDTLLDVDTDGVLGTLDEIVVSGEPVRSSTIERVMGTHPGVVVRNFYGMSEATGDVTHAVLTDDSTSPTTIGRPIDNHVAVVLDRHGRRVDVGMPGELVIAGPGLSAGYLDTPDIDPFVERDGRRWYRTGDLVVRRPDGDLDHRGRIDAMVKIAGVRIDVGDVEAALATLPGVREAVVTAEPPTHPTRLVAHLVHDEPLPDPRQLAGTLLSGPMVPARFVSHDQLPRTSTGKLDRRALIGIEPAAASGDSGAPVDDTTASVAQLMARALDLDTVGPDDDFFDLGGHSLIALRLSALLEHELGHQVPLARILLEPTPRRLAAALVGDTPETGLLVPITTAERTLFVVHGAGGHVLNLRLLADELSPDIGVVGIQAVGANGDAEPLRSVDAMADRYLAEIRAHQPVGPYLLGGFSGGGVVAFEIAHRLRQHGEEAELVLFDTYSPTATIQNVTASMHLRNLFEDGPRYVRERIENRRTRRRRGSADPALLGDEALDVAMTEAMVDAVGAYRAVPYEGRVLLLSAITENSAHRHNGEDRAWGDLLPGLVVERVEGDHETIMHAGNVEPVADLVRAWLTR